MNGFAAALNAMNCSVLNVNLVALAMHSHKGHNRGENFFDIG